MVEKIDLYCERIGTSLWAEPINALTNLAFLVAAWYVYRLAKQLRGASVEKVVLTALLVSIGVGSGLFHTFASTWARILDVIPILLFQLVYLWVYSRQIICIERKYTAGLLLVYLVAAIVGRQYPHLLNGSLIYAPALFTLLVLGMYHFLTLKQKPYLILIATGIFIVSLIGRTLDSALCPWIPVGTHFVWHICNAIALYLLTKAYMTNKSIIDR